MKAFLINLDRRPDRLEHFQAQAAALGFEFERIAAVDGNLPALQERASGLPRSILGDPIGPYALACFESHRKAWRAIVDSGAAFGLVMEDDLVLAADFAALLEDSWIPEDADIVRLEAYANMASKFDRHPAASVGKRRLHRLRSTGMNCGAYVISQQIASMLLSESTDIRDPVDAWLYHQDSPLFPRLRTYQMIPVPAIQGSFLADRESRGWTESSLEDERQVIASDRKRTTSHRRRGLRRRIMAPLWQIKARLQGMLHTRVPFG
jgi:glycosyl transferase, family 25